MKQNRNWNEGFNLRMPDGMRDWIKEEARKMARSANAQIVWMLQRQMERETSAGSGGDSAALGRASK